MKETEEIIEKKEKYVNTFNNPFKLFFRDLMIAQATELIYNKFISLAEQNHNCPLCERDFLHLDESKNFKNHVFFFLKKFIFLLSFKLF